LGGGTFWKSGRRDLGRRGKGASEDESKTYQGDRFAQHISSLGFAQDWNGSGDRRMNFQKEITISI
jgi:hypothetical protein